MSAFRREMRKRALQPWVVETIVFFLVLWQEDIRLRLRTGGWRLPLPGVVQRFYYYQFGDFANGFVNALVIDGVVDIALAARQKQRQKEDESTADKQHRSRVVRALVATALSALSIVALELHSSALTTADLQDIPAGLGGALCYLCVRLTLLNYRRTR
jgi:hypothetical protein